MQHLEGLNERQKEAVLHAEGPLLIIAGAGAGKTKTITHRIAHLVMSGVHPRSILAVTFTNKAAGEMRERALRLLPERRSGSPLLCTFHALGVRLLREFHEEAGLPRGFTIWDRDDSQRAVKAALEKLGASDMVPRAVLSVISRHKGEGLSPREYEESARTFKERTVAQAWHRYEAALREEGALDFDDLLTRMLHLLRTNERVRSLLRARWSHIIVDEYQDTSAIQYETMRILAGERRNLCVCGDLDQAIYTWRQARLENLLEFETNFPDAKVVLLEQNYRSTRTILTAANGVIEKNVRRKPKNLFTENETGEAIEIFGGRNEVEEAWFVAGKARALIESGTAAGEIAVLYRENFQSRALEEAMLALDVPYRVLGTRFFERKEVKDTLSYLRAAMNPRSRADLARVVGVPPRGIGKVTLEKMLAGEEGALPSAAAAKVRAFRECVAQIGHGIAKLPASEAVGLAIELSGMEKMYAGSDEGHERIANMRELQNLATKYDHAAPPEGIEKLLEGAALQSDQDELPADERERRGAVSLMTVHASKGLEFDTVFVTGLEQGLFPAQRENDAERDPEEERRLLYVALTRARKRLFLTFAAQRMKYGSRDFTLPSEFLDDIDARLTVRAEPPRRARSLLDDDIDTIY